MRSTVSLAHASLSRRSTEILAMPSSRIPALCLGGYTPAPYPWSSRAGGGCSHLAVPSLLRRCVAAAAAAAPARARRGSG